MSWIKKTLELIYKINKKSQTKTELANYLTELKNKGIINIHEHSMIEGILNFSNITAKDIMVPKSQMITLNTKDDIQKNIDIIIKSKHSRFPVIQDNNEKIEGILLAKDLISYLHKNNKKNINIKKLIRPALHIPESKHLDSLLRAFQQSHNHMAILVNEYAEISGLITIEDVIEQITGSIEDESDINITPNYIKKIEDNHYIVNALTPIEIFNEKFNILQKEKHFDTIGGVISQKFGYIPKAGDKIEYKNINIKILHSNKKKIKFMEVKRK